MIANIAGKATPYCIICETIKAGSLHNHNSILFYILNGIFSFFCLHHFFFRKLEPEILAFGIIKQKEINLIVQSCLQMWYTCTNYRIYLPSVQQISLSCPDYHQEVDSKNSADRRKNHMIPCFSKSGEFYKHFVEIDRIGSNDEASPKSCEMIASTLKYLFVCVISNLDKNKPRIWKHLYEVQLTRKSRLIIVFLVEIVALSYQSNYLENSALQGQKITVLLLLFFRKCFLGDFLLIIQMTVLFRRMIRCVARRRNNVPSLVPASWRFPSFIEVPESRRRSSGVSNLRKFDHPSRWKLLFVTWLYVCTHATSADLQAFKVSFLSQRLPFLFLEWKDEKQTMFKRQLMCKIIRKRVI